MSSGENSTKLGLDKSHYITVFLKNNQALTTSLKVAEVFEKRHDRVLRAIEDAKSNLPKIGDVKNAFIKTTYTDAKGADYHLPYHDCKSAFDSYARLSFINQRLLAN